MKKPILMIVFNYSEKYLKYSFVFLFLVVCSIFFSTAYAQNKKIDSLANLLVKHPQQDDERAKILLQFADYYVMTDAKQSLKFSNEIISFENKIKDKGILASIYRTKGISLYFQSMHLESIQSLNMALKINTEIKNNLGIAVSLANIGTIYLSQSKFPEALNFFLKALKEYDKLKGNELPIANTIANIGIVYTEMGNLEEAMKNHHKSLTIYQKFKNYAAQATSLSNIGTVYYKLKNINEAIRYSKLSIKLADSIGDLRTVARESGNLSAYYSTINQADLALTYGLNSVEINKKINNKKSLGFNYQNVSSAYFKKGDYKLAKIYGINALGIGNELNVTEIKRDASLGLSEVYEAMNMADSSLFYYKAYTKFADSISNDKKKNEITKMGLQYDFDKKELTYQQKQLLADEQLKQQQLQLALNQTELQKGLQFRDLQEAQLQNEKLQSEEKEKQLIIARNNEKLQASKVNELSQQQKLNKLELKQLWLYGILVLVVLGSILVYLLNLYRIRKLKFNNELQYQQAAQNELKLKHQYQLSESELKAIRSQMNPHFIFNVLNSIEAYVMDNEKRKASRLIQKFASLSRLILENSTKSLVTADKEWKAIMLYTELEAMRYENAFTYSFTVLDDIQLKTLYLPPMLVQPLIENAILHGLIIEPKADAHLSVILQMQTDSISITVADNGVGLENKSTKNAKNPVKEQSMGLASIKERIDMINRQQSAYQASFKIGPGAKQGTIAIICLPFLNGNPELNTEN